MSRVTHTCRTRPTRRQERGFTLLEVLFATGVFLVASTALFEFFSNGRAVSEHVLAQTKVTQATLLYLEQLKAMAFDDLFAMASPDPQPFLASRWPAEVTNAYPTLADGELPGFGTGAARQAMGVIYVTPLDNNTVKLEASAAWRERGNRVYGEDTNVNGVTDTSTTNVQTTVTVACGPYGMWACAQTQMTPVVVSEDKNGNGRLDSPVSVGTIVSR